VDTGAVSELCCLIQCVNLTAADETRCVLGVSETHRERPEIPGPICRVFITCLLRLESRKILEPRDPRMISVEYRRPIIGPGWWVRQNWPHQPPQCNQKPSENGVHEEDMGETVFNVCKGP
jgi:hypothetical protein